MAACSRNAAKVCGRFAGSEGTGSRMWNVRLSARQDFSRKWATSWEKLWSAKECARTNGGAARERVGERGESASRRLAALVSRAPSSDDVSDVAASDAERRRDTSAASSVVFPEPSAPVSTSVCGGPSAATCASRAACTSSRRARPSPANVRACAGEPGASMLDQHVSSAACSSHSERGMERSGEADHRDARSPAMATSRTTRAPNSCAALGVVVALKKPKSQLPRERSSSAPRGGRGPHRGLCPIAHPSSLATAAFRINVTSNFVCKLVRILRADHTLRHRAPHP